MRKSSFSAFLALPLLFSGAHGQQPAPRSSPIALNAVVTAGKHGDPLQNLAQGDFTVLDNGVAQPITSFRAVAGQADPVKVLLVLDAVNVDYVRLAYEREQIEHFLKAKDGKLSQPTALAIFTDTGTVIQPSYTTDGNALSALLEQKEIGLRDLRRSSGFYGAEERLQLSLKTLSELLAREQSLPGRKFIVWLTPGWPLLSGPSVQLSNRQEEEIYREVEGFSTQFRKTRTTLYVVDPLGAGEGPGRTFYFQQFVKGLAKPSRALPGNLAAQVFAVQSGGRFLSSSNDLSELLSRCFEDAAYRYELSYQPSSPEAGDTYHSIQVRVNRGDTEVHTLQGYYTAPAGSAEGTVAAP